jgi:hypothetical protein
VTAPDEGETPVMKRFRLACEMHTVGVEVYRLRMRAEHPDATPEEIEGYVQTWLSLREHSPEEDFSLLFDRDAILVSPRWITEEYATETSGGSMHVQNVSDEDGYPLDQFLANSARIGRKVYRRRIAVIEKWTEVIPPETGDRS